MTASHHNASTARFYALRLLPGQEVFSQLHAFVQQNQLHAAWIAGCTGSLTGEHLHLAVSDPYGAMLGGHMMPGCTVRTTLELIIGELPALTFSRQPCAISGYDELHISSR